MAPQFSEFQTITLESISRSRQRICVTAQSSSERREGEENAIEWKIQLIAF